MQPVKRILSGTPITQELLDSMVRAIQELQSRAITGVNYPLMMAGGMLSVVDNVTQALVMIRNDTGGDLDLGAVVGLDGPLEYDPTGDLPAFQNSEMTFSGIAPADPTHVGKFAVLADPIPGGSIGRACVQGIVRVQVQIDDLDVDEWADIDDATTGNLLAAETGSARILWHEDLDEPGTVWAICLLGCGSAGETTLPGETEVRTYTFKAHTGGFLSADVDAFYSVPDVLCSYAEVYVEIRQCAAKDGEFSPHGVLADHPKFRTACLCAGDYSNKISIGPDGDDEWADLKVLYLSAVGAENYSTGYGLEFRITTAGALELRFNGEDELGWENAKIYGWVKIIPYGTDEDGLEIGTAQTTDEVDEQNPNGIFYNDHEVGAPPVPDPVIYPWGDNKWRNL